VVQGWLGNLLEIIIRSGVDTRQVVKQTRAKAEYYECDQEAIIP